ncbi:energy-coupling factor transporter ATPase [Chakrabartyella piscis]|uniref:energy-coupling factor transporter ATPase n=1 Tax=Chakrabartyella piscis TaxID=2918914 RepID=UPI002958AB76|nr:energy-coupling factor transporter ATPase [Chakrabartyella piscis]
MSIQINHLTHIYNPDTAFQKVALDDVTLEITRGEFLGLIGHTGSGKSTLIQHLNGTISPTKGEILLDGENIHQNKLKTKEVRRKIGLAFQYPEYQLFEITVYQDVAFGPTNLGLSKEEIHENVVSALEMVGIGTELYEKSPFALSGGQKRRVAIAGVLAMNPEILILDEPTAGLDPKGRDEILAAIKNLHKERGLTVILVSHSMEDVAKLVDRIVVMHSGQIAMSGTPKEVFSHVEELEQMGLAAPQVSYVCKELRRKGYAIPEDVYTVSELKEMLLQMLQEKGVSQ